MSLHEYIESNRITHEDPPFYALIMAALRKADGQNLAKLQAAFPEVAAELQARYEASGGRLESDSMEDRKAMGENVYAPAPGDESHEL